MESMESMKNSAQFGFESPLWAAAGVFFILAHILLPRLGRRFFQDAFILSTPLGPPGGEAFRAPFKIAFLIKVIKKMETAAVFCLFLAAAGPRFVVTQPVWLNRGADLLFVLDVSPSMAAIDMNGQSRFEAARRLIKNFAEKRPADAVGLVAVGDDAGLLLPPTVDRKILDARLDALRVAELGDRTALGMGLAVAAFHLRRSAAPRRAVILLTDGENNAGAVHPRTAAAALEGASLYVIGMGKTGEVPIDYVDPFTKVRRTGVFNSRFDTASLAAIAESGGGVYLAAPSAEALNAAFSRLDREEMVIRQAGAITHIRSVHRPFIVAALALLAAAFLVRRHFLGAPV